MGGYAGAPYGAIKDFASFDPNNAIVRPDMPPPPSQVDMDNRLVQPTEDPMDSLPGVQYGATQVPGFRRDWS